MRNVQKYKKAGFTVFAILLALIIFLTFSVDASTENAFLLFAAKNHVWFMAILVVVAVAVGFFWSLFLYKEIESKTRTSKNMLDIVLLFLSKEEKKIISFLIEHEGKTTQAEIARIHGMNKVKAFRSLQKMQEKQLLEVVPHGKVRQVVLKENIYETLKA